MTTQLRTFIQTDGKFFRSVSSWVLAESSSVSCRGQVLFRVTVNDFAEVDPLMPRPVYASEAGNRDYVQCVNQRT